MLQFFLLPILFHLLILLQFIIFFLPPSFLPSFQLFFILFSSNVSFPSFLLSSFLPCSLTQRKHMDSFFLSSQISLQLYRSMFNIFTVLQMMDRMLLVLSVDAILAFLQNLPYFMDSLKSAKSHYFFPTL